MLGGAALRRAGDGREHCGCLDPAPPLQLESPRRRSRAIPPPSKEYPPIAWALLRDYNLWRGRTSVIRKQREKNRIADFKPSDERLALFADLARWCDERKIHPRIWLYVLFRERGWFYAPRMVEGDLMKQNHVLDYRKAKGLDGYRRHVLENVRVGDFDPNVDISPANEIVKLRLVNEGKASECMERSFEQTFGFHPASAACAGNAGVGRLPCPLAEACAKRLEEWCDFDIIGLRLGRISREQAKAAAREADAKRRSWRPA